MSDPVELPTFAEVEADPRAAFQKYLEWNKVAGWGTDVNAALAGPQAAYLVGEFANNTGHAGIEAAGALGTRLGLNPAAVSAEQSKRLGIQQASSKSNFFTDGIQPWFNGEGMPLGMSPLAALGAMYGGASLFGSTGGGLGAYGGSLSGQAADLAAAYGGGAGSSGSASLIGGAGADTLGGGMDWNWLSDYFTNTDMTGLGSGGGTMPEFAMDEFGNRIYGGQEALGSPDGPAWWDDPAGATNNAPIPASAMQQLVDAGVPFDVASKMSVQGLKSLMNMPGIGNSSLGSTIGKLLASGLGAYASNQQASAFKSLADEYSGYGAPSRARYEASYQPGFTMDNDPGYKAALDSAATANAHSLSTTFGNPAGSPTAQLQNMTDLYNKTAYPALQNYRSQNASAGGLQAASSAAPQFQQLAIGENGKVGAQIGAGINDIFNPQPSLAQSLAEYRRLSQGQF